MQESKETQGYYRFPTVHADQLVFISEDDLWTVPIEGGPARRLTSGLGACSHPSFSPDGQWIAFSSAEEGHREVYLIAARGGPLRRLTFLGATATVCGWISKSEVLFRSEAYSGHRASMLAKVSVEGGLPEPLHLGPAVHLALQAPSGAIVIERNSFRPDPAHWKRYRGGTAGKFYLSQGWDQDYQPFLTHLKGNLTRPHWIGKELYFLSDHEGVGNVYQCQEDGAEITKLTHFREFYARNLSCNGPWLVFHAGADIYSLDSRTGELKKVPIEYRSQGTQKQRKFISATDQLEAFDLSRDGQSLCLTSRGHVASMGHWWGATKWSGRKAGVRFRLGRWCADDRKILMVSDEGREEHLVTHDLVTNTFKAHHGLQQGRVVDLKPSPQNPRWAALSNHRNELLLVDLDQDQTSTVCKNQYGSVGTFNWSPDGRFLAYSLNHRPNAATIKLLDTETRQNHTVTPALFDDFHPVFDPDGEYLYFLSNRTLEPVYDALHFDLGFYKTTSVYVVTLKKNALSPLLPTAPSQDKTSENNSNKGADSTEAISGTPPKIPQVQIDFEGITERVQRLPLPAAKYYSLAAAKKKVFFASWPVESTVGRSWFSRQPEAKGELQYFDLQTLITESFLSGITNLKSTPDGSHLAIQVGQGLRVIPTGEKPKESRLNEDYSKKMGWIDLGRLPIEVDPAAEWEQMLHEVWRLQRDHFWREDMSKVRWNEVFEVYRPLLNRVSCRSEFGDLVWEIQGELGTSHAYEIGGDYRTEPHYSIGFLGAEYSWDSTFNGYRIDKIFEGDSWDPMEASPLRSPGVMANAGDVLLSIHGRSLTKDFTPQQALVNLAQHEVEIDFLRAPDKNQAPESQVPKTHRLKTLSSETKARYRAWVETNRKYVHQKSGGVVGYVHIPDMSATGYAEFHRSYLQEYDHDALVVDVRFNGGGHVSQLLLEKLSRKRIGFCESRWMMAQPFFSESPAGPLVALTNEFAGSDGDIFSHSFKLLKLGPLIGTRTWGGVVGISPRHHLVDGGVTTQPEFSFWFSDVGWNVENHGTDPDVVVDNLPHHYRQSIDPQLDVAIDTCLKALAKTPPFRPKATDYPDLSVQ